MPEVKRYRYSRCKLHFDPQLCLCGPWEHPAGDYVKHSDYAALERQLADARKRCEELQQPAEAPKGPEKWVCFHCDFATSSEAEARAHFGDCDDAGEFTPLCKWWSNMDDQERKEQFQALLQELNGERRRCEALQTSNDGLEYQVGSQEQAIRSYKPFRDCRTINDVFFVYDSMEGRALAAEEQNADLRQQLATAKVEGMNDAAAWLRHNKMDEAADKVLLIRPGVITEEDKAWADARIAQLDSK